MRQKIIKLHSLLMCTLKAYHRTILLHIFTYGSLEKRLAFVFDLWDDSEDGQIDRKELTNLLSAMYERAGIRDQKGEWDPKKRAKEIIAKLDISGDKKLNKEEFVTGCMNDQVICKLLLPRSS
ncbi:unnamed protein product [Adineta steineri]|uniref:EF-hand domain-containing protein n=1 Tax=Adineta steineri TaxID=433720 RepID=A0A813ZFT5_9BILA|nr:unnamed protein product [Adineta steineri]